MNSAPNVNMANLGNMGGPVGGAPMPMMNNVPGPQQGGPRPQVPTNENSRTLLNTYIYEYFIRFGMNDCARTLLQGDHQVHVIRDGPNRRRDENGNVINGVGGDAMDTDNKDDMDGKLPDDLPAPKLPKTSENTSFLHEWFCLFWDMYSAQRKPGSTPTHQYVNHTVNQSRMRQNQQQEMLRQMRPDVTPHQYQMMRMPNGSMGMAGKQGLVRAAMANNQNHPPGAQMMQQGKQNQMQRDPSDPDGNRQRPGSPGSAENAPSPSKRPRLGDAAFNSNQAGMRQVSGAPGQVGGGNLQYTYNLLQQHGINPTNLTPQQMQQFAQQTPAVQAKSIATYSSNLQQQQSGQMGNRPMGNIPQGQGSPMMPQGPEGAAAIGAYYNAEMGGGPGGMRPVPGGGQPGTGSNHALQDYQLQLMLLEQQNKKRLMMARQEQDNMGGMPRDGPNGPGGPTPQGPNGQMMPEGSPQGARSGASPNPQDQMKRGTPQMANNMGSPHPEGAQSRGSPNAMNFMGGEMNPAMAPQFMNGNMVGNGQMNGMRPPSSHPNQQFNGPMNPQMMAGRGQQQQGAGGNQPNAQVQWQQGGPNNNQMMQQGQGQGQVQGTPQQRNSMPPPSGPAAAASNANNRTSSPQQPAQQGTPQPPTPSQAPKAGPKKKESKSAKSKAAAQKKNAAAASAATSAEAAPEAEAPTPATPMTPSNAQFKAGQAGGAANAAPAAASGPSGPQATTAPTSAPPAAPPATQAHPDPTQNNFGMENGGAMVDFTNMDFANPLTSEDVLTDFNFDAFLHDDADTGNFDFSASYGGMDATGEIGAE